MFCATLAFAAALSAHIHFNKARGTWEAIIDAPQIVEEVADVHF